MGRQGHVAPPRRCVNLFRNALELDKSAELCDHHSLFTLQTTRQGRPVALLVLIFHVIPNLAIGTFAIPAEVAVRDRVDGKILKATQESIVLRHADVVAHDFQMDQLFVRIEQIRRTAVEAAICWSLVTHRQRQYNHSLLKFVH
jgi:hypothetical protein